MRFKLKTVFLLTFIFAMLAGSFSVSVRTSSKVRRLETLIDNAVGTLQTARGQHRDDFIIYSSGTSWWHVEIDDESETRIALKWRSRFWFGKEPNVTLFHRGTSQEREFTDRLRELFKEHAPEIEVRVSER